MAKYTFALVAALVFSLLTGCQTAPKSTAMDSPGAMPTKALLVTGNGGSTVVFIPGDKPGEVAVLASSDMPVCAQCNADAVKYFQTGELIPVCSVCGAKRTPLSVQSAVTSHAHN
jgi:hypothetical protein